MRILVTGARGQLGSELLALAGSTPHQLTGAGTAECDLRSPASVDAALRRTRPDAVINCAAWTKVDLAESHREDAFSVNADGAAHLARACATTGSLLCQISTDYVFRGDQDAALDETVEPFPLGVYGASKLAGERAVQAILPYRHVIVRTAWLYGREGPNFVLTMLRLAREQRRLRVVADQTGTPTWTGHLAPAILRLLELDPQGIFHLTASGSTTWHGFAQAIVHEAGLGGVVVEPLTTADYPTAAQRPRFSLLDNRRWREAGQPPLPDWREGLRAYLAGLRDSGALPGVAAGGSRGVA
jgi:dTDP-4-dehydrorhamnose reductase